MLDAQGHTVYVNPMGATLLGSTADELLGRPSPFSDLPIGTTTEPGDLQVHISRVPESGMRTVHFRVQRALRRERQVAAFANTAAAIARDASLETVLDRLAAEVRAATGMATCAVVLMDGRGRRSATSDGPVFPLITSSCSKPRDATAHPWSPPTPSTPAGPS